jgi:hypothetical protein
MPDVVPPPRRVGPWLPRRVQSLWSSIYEHDPESSRGADPSKVPQIAGWLELSRCCHDRSDWLYVTGQPSDHAIGGGRRRVRSDPL